MPRSAVADRAYVMVRGRIVRSASATELAADPQAIADSYFEGPTS